MNIKRSIIFVSAFIFPPLVIGTLLAFSNLSSVMLCKTPAPLATSADSLQPPPLTRKLKAAILVSNEGTQITDLLGPFEILAESGVFDVFTVAPKRTLSPTTGAVDLFPHYSFDNAPKADLLVIPAVLDPLNPELASWLEEKAKDAKLILSLCEGARLAVQAHLIQKMDATSHFLAIPELKQLEPSSNWVNGPRYVLSGKVISSAGVTASMDAALFAIEKLAGREIAQTTASKLGYPWSRETGIARTASPEIQPSEFFPLFFRAGYRWVKDRWGVLLYAGVDEIRLAAALDVFSRTQDYTLFTVAPVRQIYRSAHGLDLVPRESAAEMLPADLLLIPSDSPGLRGSASSAWSESLNDPVMKKWMEERQVPSRIFAAVAPGGAYEEGLDRLLETQGPLLSRFVAKMIEYPRLSTLPRSQEKSARTALDWPISLWIKPILIGIAGLLLAAWIERRITTRKPPPA